MEQFSAQTEAILLMTNCPDQQTASELARQLLEQQLAACVNILPAMQSMYRWQGAIESASEVALLIKTTKLRYAQLEQAIKALHPYQVPEIIALPIVAGSSDYLHWIAQETS
jgi:periplasmic divalent cation tolerance protein